MFLKLFLALQDKFLILFRNRFSLILANLELLDR